MADVKVLKTNKGGIKIVHNNYQYRKKKENLNGTITWKCCECPARLQTRLAPEYQNPRVLGVHNHLGDPLVADIIKHRQDMKDQIQERPEMVPTVIYRERCIKFQLMLLRSCQIKRLLDVFFVGNAPNYALLFRRQQMTLSWHHTSW